MPIEIGTMIGTREVFQKDRRQNLETADFSVM